MREVIAGTESVAGNSPGESLAAGSRINRPTGLGQDARCNVYIADTGNQLVRMVTPLGRLRNVRWVPGLVTLRVLNEVWGPAIFVATQDTLYRLTYRQ